MLQLTSIVIVYINIIIGYVYIIIEHFDIIIIDLILSSILYHHLKLLYYCYHLGSFLGVQYIRYKI